MSVVEHVQMHSENYTKTVNKEVVKVDDNEIKLHLESLNLKVVPENVLTQSSITYLSLDYNELQTLPCEFCSHLVNLNYLSLNGNELDKLPVNIGLLLNLTELHLNENFLNELPDSLVELKKLEKLYIVGNLLKYLPHGIAGLESLKELSIDENFLMSLPNDFGHLKSLERLEASNNKIEFLPENFGSLTKLVSLNLSHNVLKILPSTFGMLPSLTEMDLSENKISHFPELFHSAQNLRKLFAENNNITCIPPWFADSKNLLELSLKDNCLTGFPFPEFFGYICINLEYFDLSGNNVEALPDSFSELKHLKFFDAGSSLYELERNRNIYNGNLLIRLPEHFGNLTSLCELHLDENYLKELPTNFGCLVNLKFLDLNHNNLEALPESFGDLHSLRVCMVSLNDLQHLPSSFGNLHQLEELCLDNNRLSELPESFWNLTRLVTLDLYNNCLTKIPQELKFLINLTHLDLGENNFGVPIDEVPEIIYKPVYVTHPEKKDNWRGRPRPEFSKPEDLTMSLVLNEEEKSVHNEKLHLSKEKLCLALENSKFYQKHVTNENSDFHSRSILSQNEAQDGKKETSYSSEVECNGRISFEESCTNPEVNILEIKNSVNSEEKYCSQQDKSEAASSEYWDDDFIDVVPYVSVEVSSGNVEKNMVDEEYSLSEYSDSDSDENSSKMFPHENRNKENQNTSYDNGSLVHHPMPSQYGPFLQAFIPSDIHANPVQKIRVTSVTEDGQFDDADL